MTVALALVAALGAPAYAEATPNGSVVVSQQAGGQVTKADPSWTGDKPAAPEPPVTTQALCSVNCPLTPSASKSITPPGGTTGNINAYGTTTADVTRPFPYLVPCQVNYRNSTSTVSWTGSKPYNATNVTQTDTWDTDSIGVSITISSPPGGSFSPAKGTQQWSTTTGDTWRTTHSWNNIQMRSCAWGRITGVNFNESGSFQFGSAYYGVQAYFGAGVVA
ncbi:hypothetical protein AB0K00_54345 [Dactylosporangium sp. NPDC049525]|uniref:hypothetical protein n=1 Tax=Dactylosporangium sp. NPDC049525 TaxID=3154730 RepID=UPI00343A5514